MELLRDAPTESGFKDDHVGRLNERSFERLK